ncbi:hypothetical protein XENOCAPTIV_021482, partial [Xenoophorus captivus]
EALRRYEELAEIFSDKDNYSHSRELLKEEFEVLAQIRLLQSSCKNCVFIADESFLQWYHSVPTLTEEQSLAGDGESPFDFHSPVNNFLSKLTKHMRSPSVSCLDVDTSPPTNESTPVALTPSTPTKSHRRSASCGNNLPSNVPGSGPDMRIIRIRMDLQDGNLYRSILVQISKPFNSNSTSAVSG